MRRNTSLVLLASMVVALGLLLIPTTEAGRPGGSKVAPQLNSAAPTRKADISGLLNRLHAGPKKQDQDQVQRIEPAAAGLPNVLNSKSALSAALLLSLGGINTQFDEVTLIADWDGREDFGADRAQKQDDLSAVIVSPDQFITRNAISEHTVANGFNENVFYYGDSIGNFFVGTDTNPNIIASGQGVDTLRQINIPTLVNTGTDGGFTIPAGGCTDAKVTVTGIAVNPVADLGDFGACGTIGEVIYVSILDSGACSGAGIRTRIIAFAVTDGVGAAAATPAGALPIFTSTLSNGGLTVDDDGSLYFQLIDKATLANGAAIFKATELPRTVCATPGRINRVIPSIPAVNLATAAPVTAAGITATNYSGTSTAFGNIAALTAGPNNIIYAAVSRSFRAADDAGTQATEGPYTNPAALGDTPSMIISFADRAGAFDICSGEPVPAGPNVGGVLPIADGVADVAQTGLTLVAGVNNFRVFALGNGPDIRPVAPALSPIVTSQTLRVDMQIDSSINAGIAVDEMGTAFVISGGSPAGVGTNPSPVLGEILVFPDRIPADRRADFIDLRGDNLPNPPASGGNVGDGDSDRFDHLYWRAPLDLSTQTPTGISGLSRGFLRYTNRLAPNEISPTVTLGQTGGQRILGDDDSSNAQIFFEGFDPGHQVAGGDDQNTPFRGDDNDGAGNTPFPGALNGGFEFTFGGPVGTAGCVWNSFFLNSNGNITFGTGDTDNTASVTEFRQNAPKIAGAWADLNPGARGFTFGAFPIQALGFADVNAFKIRNINVPMFSSETCTAQGASGATNTFSTTLFDDGTGIDENANQPLNPANPIGNNAVPFDLQEGPTDLRFTREPNTNLLLQASPRREGSGNFVFSYGRMDLLGTLDFPVIAGYSIGGLDPLNPPGLCETKLGPAADSAAAGPGVIQGQTASIQTGLIGEGTEPTIYELFDCGVVATGAVKAKSDFNLRFQGNDTPSAVGQPNPDRDNVGLFGISCSPPANPTVTTFVLDPFVTTPGTTGLTNAIGPVGVNILGSNFLLNEVTTLCGGSALNCSSDPAPPGPSEPISRPGKTVSAAATLSVDTNGDGIPESTVSLQNVTVVSPNLIKATIGTVPGLPGTGFPLAGSGGTGTITVTNLFTGGDNNVFGPFTRTAAGSLAVGIRAPVVLGVSASSGSCGLPQDVLISGSSFIINGIPNVTSVFALDEGDPGTRFDATSFTVLSTNQITARFNFGAASAGKTFRIYLSGPGGTSRNMVVLPAGTPPGTPAGNEAGNPITFSCATADVNAISFSSPTSSITEDCAVAPITVTRGPSSTGTVSVQLSTSDGTAAQKSDYTMTFATITFGPGETSKVVNIPITEDSFVEGNETLNLILSNPTGGAQLGSQSTATLTILDDDAVPTTVNPIDDTPTFVGQQYHDFLNRQGDATGVAFWVGTITACGADPNCIQVKRINASAAFFLSGEFQDTGFYVLCAQRAAFGKKSASSASRYAYLPFLQDAQQVGAGVVVGQPGADALLEANKQAYATQVVNSAAFITAYPLAQTASQYVDALFATATVVPSAAERSAAITAFGGGGTSGRVAAFRSVVGSASLQFAEFNPSFVLMQYYGYLRRNPTDLPDTDDSGYQFWLGKLNAFNGNFINAELVKAFINSAEYRQRFGTP